MAHHTRHLGLVLLAAAAIGCPTTVAAPTASIKGGATISGLQIGQLVFLDGTQSKDPQNRDVKYNWQFLQLPIGSAAALNDVHSATPSFVADVDGTYQVQLIVSNAFVSSAPVTQSIKVSKCGGRAPVIQQIDAADP